MIVNHAKVKFEEYNIEYKMIEKINYLFNNPNELYNYLLNN